MSIVDHGIQTSKVEVRAATEDGCRHWPFGVVNRVVSQKDEAGQGHSLGEFVTSHGPLVSWTRDMAMAGDE